MRRKAHMREVSTVDEPQVVNPKASNRERNEGETREQQHRETMWSNRLYYRLLPVQTLKTA